MREPRNDTGWVSSRTHEELVRCLALREPSRPPSCSEAELEDAFVRLCAEAVVQDVPPEGLLEEFRQCWDTRFPPPPGHRPRELLYYHTLSRCLDIYLDMLLGAVMPAAPVAGARPPARPSTELARST